MASWLTWILRRRNNVQEMIGGSNVTSKLFFCIACYIKRKSRGTLRLFFMRNLNCNQAKQLLDGLAHSIINHFHTTGVIKAALKCTISVKQKYHTA